MRVSSKFSGSWDVENGIGQGAVLSGFLFNVLVDCLAAEIRRVCNGFTCAGRAGSMQVQILMYADDVVIVSDDPTALQRALGVAAVWARSWRFYQGHWSVTIPICTVLTMFGGRDQDSVFPHGRDTA